MTEFASPIVRRSPEERDAYMDGLRAGIAWVAGLLLRDGHPVAARIEQEGDVLLALIRSTFEDTE